jgi:hypothetical protein
VRWFERAHHRSQPFIRAASGQGKASPFREMRFPVDSPGGGRGSFRIVRSGGSPHAISTACPLVVLGAGRWLLWRHCRGGCSIRFSPRLGKSLPAGQDIAHVHAASCQRSDQTGEGAVPAFWNSLVLFCRCSRSCHPEITGRAKLMKAARARLIQQGQQRSSKILHLLFRLGAGLGCIRVEQGT